MSQQTHTMRVVEAEIKPIDWQQVKLPKVDLEPARQITEQVLLTGIGLGVLLVRGVRAAVQAAYKAGSEEAGHPGAVSKVVDLVRKPGAEKDRPIALKVPVMPIADYEFLGETEIVERLQSLDQAQLAAVRAYEENHLNRSALLAVIQGRLQA